MEQLLSIVLFVCCGFTLTNADFRNDALVVHNYYRAKHHSPALELNKVLNNYAQNWARKMANTNFMRHSNGKYSENVYMSSDTKLSDSAAVKRAITKWYNEISMYSYNNPGYSMPTGHFTQLVWKNTKRLGIGIARSSKGVYVCANYDPAGNVRSQLARNVLRP